MSNSIIIEKIEQFVQINKEIKTNVKLLHVFKGFFDKINVILLTNEDKVYCFGGNECGVLGFGHENNVIEFIINEELSNKRIINFKSSKWHTIASNSDGKLYCWGSNRYLGNGKYYEISKPELNKYLINENIIDMCCGFEHTLVLTSNNEVYGWGGNRWGQIGNRSSGKDECVFIPFKVDEFSGEKVKEISCGLYHSMALTKSGCVYSWGHNYFGQLGLNSENEIENKPKLIKIEVEIKKISCGQWHTLFLSCEGDIYVFGSNKYKQLGIETNEEKQSTPIKLNHSEKFMEIAAHYDYEISAALSENGLYYVWGDCGKNLFISQQKVTQFKSFEEILIILTEFKNGKFMNWREMSEIGCGSYGKVSKVEHKIFRDKIFAIKKIPIGEYPWNELSPKELYIFDLLRDENEFLLKYYDGWIERDFQMINGNRIYSKNHTIYIRMDLCDKTLSSILEEIHNDSKLYSNNSLTLLGYYLLSQLFIDILKGVQCLHNNHIIHRKLHLNNILMKSETDGNCAKIGDFGLAKIQEMNKLHTKNREHLKYEAPEVGNNRNYSTKADIYSLGVILQKLFEIDFNKQYRNNSPDMTSKYECLEELYEMMTMRKPKKRPNCQQILDEKENWTINEIQFNFKEELNILLSISKDNKSYVQNIIVSKLPNFIDKPKTPIEKSRNRIEKTIKTCLIF